MSHELTPHSAIRYLPFYNSYAGDVPSFGVIQITGWTTSDGRIYMTATRPTGSGKPDMYAINSRSKVTQGRYGLCTFDLPHRVAYDAAFGTPAAGDTWGPQKDSFLARKGPVYYRSLGSPGDGTTLLGAPAQCSPFISYTGSGGIAAMSGSTPGSATLTVYEFNTSNVLTAATRTETVYNMSLTAVGGSKWVQVKQERETGRYVVDFEDCT